MIMAGNVDPMHFLNTITTKQLKYSHSITKDQLKQTPSSQNSAPTSTEDHKTFFKEQQFAHNRSSPKYSHSITKHQLKQTPSHPNSASTSTEDHKTFFKEQQFAPNRSSANNEIDSYLNDFEASKKKHSKEAEEIELLPEALEEDTYNSTKPFKTSPNLKRSRRIRKAPNRFSPSRSGKLNRRFVIASPEQTVYANEKNQDTRFCSCKQIRNLDMVLCSNYKKCQEKWFHFDASGNGCVQYNPIQMKGKKWFCPGCEANSQNRRKPPIEAGHMRTLVYQKNIHHVQGSRNQNSIDPSEDDFDVPLREDKNVYSVNPTSQAKKDPPTLSEAKRDEEDELKCLFKPSLHEPEQHFPEDNHGLTSDGHVVSETSATTSLKNKTPVYLQDENEWEDSPPNEEYEFSKTMYDSTYSVPKSCISKQKSRNYVNRRKQVTNVVPCTQSPLLRKVLKVKGVIDKDTECYPSSIGLRIPYREWKLYYKRTNPSKLEKGYAHVIDKYIRQDRQIPCAFFSFNYYALKSGHNGQFTIRGYCGGKNCPVRFKCCVKKIVPGKSVKVEVSVSGKPNCIQSKKSGRPTTGILRKQVQAALLHDSAYRVYAKSNSKLDPTHLLHQNTEFRSYQALQKMKSEGYIASRPKRTNLVADLKVLKTKMANLQQFQGTNSSETSGYIQRIHLDPFGLTLYSPIQVRYASMTDILHVDATGTISKLPYVDSKRVLLHAVVGKIKTLPSIPSVPLLEFLTNSHTTAEIMSHMRHFVSDVKKYDANWRPAVICSDFSFAYLHAASEVFNTELLMDNVTRSWERMVAGELNPPNKTRIQLCSAHILISWSRNLKAGNVPKSSRNLAMHSLAKLMETRTFKDLREASSQIISLFGAEKLPQQVCTKFHDDLKNNTLQKPFEEFLHEFHLTVKTDEEMGLMQPAAECKSQRDKSPYFHFFRKREQTVLSKLRDEMDSTYAVNPYYCPTALNSLKNIYVPYLPLWSNCCPEYPLNGKNELISNAPIERYFNTHKNSLHPKLREDPVVYAEEHGDYAVGIVNAALTKAIECETSKANVKELHVKKDDKQVDEFSSQHSTENWGKSEPKLKPLYLKRNESDFFLQRSQEVALASEAQLSRKLLTKVKRSLKSKRNLTQEFESSQASDSSPQLNRTQSKKIIKKKPEFLDLSKVEEEPCVDDDFESLRSLSIVCKVGNYLGHEGDMASLSEGKWLTDSVMHCYGQLILEGRGEKYAMIQSFAVTNHTNGDTIEWFTSESMLPKKNGDVPERFFAICNSHSHWFLTVLHTENQCYYDYDSSKGIVPEKVKLEYQWRLVELVQSRYSLAKRAWIRYVMETPEQVDGNSCGVIVLKVMEALVNNERASDVNPFRCPSYRKEIANSLLQTDDFGKQLLESENGNVSSVLERCKSRAYYRDLLTTMESTKKSVKKSLDGVVSAGSMLEIQKKLEKISFCENDLRQNMAAWRKV
jgi:hypothetical protein